MLDFYRTPTCLAFSLYGNAATLTLQRPSVVLWVRVAKSLQKREERGRLELVSFLQGNAVLSEEKKPEDGVTQGY